MSYYLYAYDIHDDQSIYDFIIQLVIIYKFCLLRKIYETLYRLQLDQYL